MGRRMFSSSGFALVPLAMTETNAERFLREAEECLRQAETALSALDQLSWLRLAQEWTKLAKETERKHHPS